MHNNDFGILDVIPLQAEGWVLISCEGVYDLTEQQELRNKIEIENLGREANPKILFNTCLLYEPLRLMFAPKAICDQLLSEINNERE